MKNFLYQLNSFLQAAAAYEASEVSSTSTGQGASLVGVEDPGNIFAGTTVEAVLAELYNLVTQLTPNKAVVTNGLGQLTTSTTSDTEIGYVAGVTSPIQTQINAKQAATALLTALGGLSSAGFIAGNGSAATERTLTAGAGISITNPTGSGGDPAFSIANSAITPAMLSSAILKAIDALATTGFVSRTGAGTVATRTLTAGTGITVANGDGVSGNPSAAITNTAVSAGTYNAPASLTVNAQGQLTSVTAGQTYPLDPTVFSSQFDDWINSTTAGALNWVETHTGTGAAGSCGASGAEAFHQCQGTLILTTGTTTTGRDAVALGPSMGFGYGTITQNWRMFVPVLATVPDDYDIIFGYGDTPAGAGIGQTNAAYFLYDRATSANWQCVTVAGGAATTIDSGVAVSNAAFTKYKIVVTNSATVQFYISGVLVGTSSTNIPGFVQFIGPIAKIAKLAGTTACLAEFDYFQQLIAFGSAR